MIPVWELSDNSIFSDSEWINGQVEVNNRKVQFEAVKGGVAEGWVAIDKIVVVENRNECETVPLEAQLTTVLPETTTPSG